MRLVLLLLILAYCIRSSADDQNRPLRPGRPHWQGNEHSEHPPRFSNGQPTIGGNGCPQGTMQVIFAPDFLSFTVLFDNFVAQSTADMKRAVMDCNAVIPMQLPAGMQMEITRVDLRGFAGVPAQAHAVLNTVFNFVGAGGDKDRIHLTYTFQGPYSDNYLVSTDAMNQNAELPTSEVSPCGGQTSLRINTRLSIQAPVGQTASITLDSVDSSSHAIYYVNWKTCTTSPGSKPANPPGHGQDGGGHQDHGGPQDQGGPQEHGDSQKRGEKHP